MVAVVVVCSCAQKLANIKGLSDAKVEKLLEASKKVLPAAGWLTGTTALQRVSLLMPGSCRRAAGGLPEGLQQQHSTASLRR